MIDKNNLFNNKMVTIDSVINIILCESAKNANIFSIANNNKLQLQRQQCKESSAIVTMRETK